MKDMKKIQVLLIEDQEITAKVFKESIEKLHCHVDIVENGEMAIEKSQAKKYDLILCDWLLPDINGDKITQNIRQNKGLNQSVSIIGVTGNIPEERRAEWVKQGANDVILKEEILNNIEKILEVYCGR